MGHPVHNNNGTELETDEKICFGILQLLECVSVRTNGFLHCLTYTSLERFNTTSARAFGVDLIKYFLMRLTRCTLWRNLRTPKPKYGPHTYLYRYQQLWRVVCIAFQFATKHLLFSHRRLTPAATRIPISLPPPNFCVIPESYPV